MTKAKKTVKKKVVAKKPAAGKKAVAKQKSVPAKGAKSVKKVSAANKALKKVQSSKKPAAPAKKAKAAKAGKVLVKEVKSAPKLKLTPRTADEFKSMLITMRQRLSGQIAALQGDSLLRQDAVNSEEDGTDAFERQLALSLASTENDVVFEIDEALHRIEQKTYGVCEQCGCGIESARLKALPFVRMCIGCKTETEKGNRRFRPNPVQ